eukprot:gnl/MRDRNA2_/MRDRNA2_96341_c0_seq1.p2 gnl/MRDRNA2_/MRDRNA2_96341_c0~~gnl/MRDRNA2_/MRDRNA2_96341_c0_seq1.p2  ORF type:complete len:190 (+),score=20.73 gnl/MRDRNA2_/MRDRNA2_96341_c0_seq1:99-668(+)
MARRGISNFKHSKIPDQQNDRWWREVQERSGCHDPFVHMTYDLTPAYSNYVGMEGTNRGQLARTWDNSRPEEPASKTWDYSRVLSEVHAERERGGKSSYHENVFKPTGRRIDHKSYRCVDFDAPDVPHLVHPIGHGHPGMRTPQTMQNMRAPLKDTGFAIGTAPRKSEKGHAKQHQAFGFSSKHFARIT